MLTLPLVDHKDVLVGVMQVLNKSGGVFDDDDEALATALAAQCAVALQRVRMTGALIEGEKMDAEQLAARGANTSLIHVDWMIGSGEMDVDGITAAAVAEPLMRKGEWV